MRTSQKGRHAGETCYVLGNGPSLAEVDFALLEGEVVFATNRINLHPAYEGGWRPTYYVVSTALVGRWLEDMRAVMGEEGVEGYAAEWMREYFEDLEGVTYFPCDARPVWSHDASERVTKYGGSLFPMLQIAEWMGFVEARLLGCDLGFVTLVPGEPDVNHFSEDYLRWAPEHRVERWKVELVAAHEMARDASKMAIVNYTEGGELEVYPRMELKEA